MVNPKCYDCGDLGLLEAQTGDMAVHFHCSCDRGEIKVYELPRWGVKYFEKFTVLPNFPERRKMWIPKLGDQPGHLIQLYSARIKVSEDYWAYYGF